MRIWPENQKGLYLAAGLSPERGPTLMGLWDADRLSDDAVGNSIQILMFVNI